MKKFVLLQFLLLFLVSPIIETLPAAEPFDPQKGHIIQIESQAGYEFIGRIIFIDSEMIIIETRDEMEIKIRRKHITRIKKTDEDSFNTLIRIPDPNYSRLMFAPTARPLKQGDGYFADYEILFPGIGYGITDNIGFFAGFSLIPGLSLDKQVLYIAPKIGWDINPIFSLACGILLGHVSEAFTGGLLFGMGTHTHPDLSLTLGIGLSYYRYKNTNNDTNSTLEQNSWSEFLFNKYPVLVAGGNIRLSNHLALISENWLLSDPAVKISQQPFGIALRIIGNRFAADIGFIIVGEIIKQGIPIPWLSLIYNY